MQQSLTALSRLTPGQVPLKESLTTVAQLAVHAIPRAEGAGLTLREHDGSDTLVATAAFVSAVDAIQYGLGEGPCISAAAQGLTVQSHALGIDTRWPRFGSEVVALGVHSALSLPLVNGDRVLGAMNIYARPENAFSDRAVELGQLFALPAAVAVQNAQVLAQADRLATELQRALSSRGPVNQAMGVLMSLHGISPDEALERLRTQSRAEGISLHEVAQTVIDQAVRRATSHRRGNR